MSRKKEDKSLVGMWECPNCLYERTPEVYTRCRVCTKYRPGYEEEEEVISEVEEEEVFSFSPHLIVTFDTTKIRNELAYFLRRMRLFTPIVLFEVDLMNDVEVKKKIHDKLKENISCLVIDQLLLVRQQEWLQFAKLHNIYCDIITDRPEIVLNGFHHVFKGLTDDIIGMFDVDKTKNNKRKKMKLKGEKQKKMEDVEIGSEWIDRLPEEEEEENVKHSSSSSYQVLASSSSSSSSGDDDDDDDDDQEEGEAFNIETVFDRKIIPPSSSSLLLSKPSSSSASLNYHHPNEIIHPKRQQTTTTTTTPSSSWTPTELEFFDDPF